MKVIDSMWFNTAQGNFGIVVGENEVRQRNMYAGVVRGFDQEADENAILAWGNKVNIRMLEGLIDKTHSRAIEEAKRVLRRVEKEKGRKR